MDKVEDPGTSTVNVDKTDITIREENPNISITNVDWADGVEDLDKNTTGANGVDVAKDLNIFIADTDKAKDPNSNIADVSGVDGVENPDIGIANANGVDEADNLDIDIIDS